LPALGASPAQTLDQRRNPFSIDATAMSAEHDPDESKIYDVLPPAPRPVEDAGEELLPLPYVSIDPPVLEADTASWKQFALGCALPFVVAGIILAAAKFAPLVPMIFLSAAAVLGFGGAIQWGIQMHRNHHWRNFFPGVVFGLAAGSIIAMGSCLAPIRDWL
jgi:hypothetical protein